MDKLITPLEEKIQRAFRYVMFDPSFIVNKNKRFRILFFSYIFGCIHVSTLSTIFAYKNFHEYNNAGSLNNSNRSILSYLCSKGLLSKVAKDYYMVTSRAVDLLFDFLKDHNYLHENDRDAFLKYCCKKTSHATHAVKNGEAVLSLLQDTNFNFIIEPYIDELGNRYFPSVNQSTQNTLIPDALFYTSNNLEYILLESDSCEERISSKLIPKFERYCKNILRNTKPSSVTIIFSVWSKSDEKHMFSKQLTSINNLLYVYEFIQKSAKSDVSFKAYLNELQSYDGCSSDITKLSDFVREIPAQHYNSPETFRKLYDTYLFKSLYSKPILTRRNALMRCVTQVPYLLDSIYSGTRLVFFPNSSCNTYYKFNFLNPNNDIKKGLIYIQNNISSYSDFIYYTVRDFADISCGDMYSFRNVFEINISTHKLYIAFENITDDIGGYYRIKRYIYKKSFNIKEKIIIVCIYNELILSNPLSYLAIRSSPPNNLFFISYGEFSLL